MLSAVKIMAFSSRFRKTAPANILPSIQKVAVSVRHNASVRLHMIKNIFSSRKTLRVFWGLLRIKVIINAVPRPLATNIAGRLIKESPYFLFQVKKYAEEMIYSFKILLYYIYTQKSIPGLQICLICCFVILFCPKCSLLEILYICFKKCQIFFDFLIYFHLRK